jgi:anti-sigma factor RsiW
MNCETFEDLLPRYVDGELSDGERRQVSTHLRECASCREALSFYEELETSLVARRELRPASRPFAVEIARRLVPRPARGVLSALVGLPGILSGAFILAGIILFVFRNTIAQFLARFDEGFQIRLSPLADELMRDPARFAGGDELTLLAVYVGVFALIMLTGSWMVLRFVRS